jgi:hypothetical protein
MIIYSNGCSHTFGHCVKKDDVWVNLIMKNLKENYIKFNSHLYNFTKETVVDEDNIYINESKCGAGNDYIFHTSIESISKLISYNKKPDYVFIQWSSPNRRMHCLPNGEIKFVNPQDNIEYQVKFEPMGSEHTLHYMFSLQEFLKKENINYFFINYMGLDMKIKDLSIYRRIDFSKIIDFGFGENILIEGILNYIKKNNMSCDDLGHPNKKGNEFIANKIIERI